MKITSQGEQFQVFHGGIDKLPTSKLTNGLNSVRPEDVGIEGHHYEDWKDQRKKLNGIDWDDVEKKFNSGTLPVEKISLDNLHTTQAHLTQEGLRDRQKNREAPDPVSGDKYPWIIQHKGRKWIEDGHHRLAVDKLNGETSSLVRVYRTGIE